MEQIVTKPHLVFVISEDWAFWTHRLNLAKAAIADGFNVTLVTRCDNHVDRIKAEGISVVPFKCGRRLTNPISLYWAIQELSSIFRHLRPDIVHNVTIKNVIIGSVAARLAGVKNVVNAVAGFGYLSNASGWKNRTMQAAVRFSLRIATARMNMPIIVQNVDDRQKLIDWNVATPPNVVLMRGAGIDVMQYKPSPPPVGIPVVLMACRMIWSKGVREFVEAAKLVKSRGIMASFVLAGRVDTDNPAHVPEQMLRLWHEQGDVEWLEHCEEMPRVYASSSIVCLPTFYGEGLPKVLLEAAACGKPLITTDTPGCRDICRDGVNGRLVPPRDVKALADAICELVLDSDFRHVLGCHGRAIVEAEFTAESIAAQTVALYRTLVPRIVPFPLKDAA